MAEQQLSIRQGVGDLRGYTIYRPGRLQRAIVLVLMIFSAGLTGLLMLTCASMIQLLTENLNPGYMVRLLILLTTVYMMSSATLLLNELSGMFVALSQNTLLYRAFGVSGKIPVRNLQQFTTAGHGFSRVWGIQLRDPVQLQRGWYFYVLALFNPMIHNHQIDRFIPLHTYFSGTIQDFSQTRMGQDLLHHAPDLALYGDRQLMSFPEP